MEWLKIAFVTLVIGALALPWLWLFMRIFFERSASRQDNFTFPIISALSKTTQETVAAVLVIAMGYFLGSAVSRISSDFFDDNEILRGMPTHSSIQEGVYLHEYCVAHVLVAQKLPEELLPAEKAAASFCYEETGDKNLDPKTREVLVTEFFRVQEGKLLIAGEEKIGRLRELHDQIEILRGATLNGVILFTLSWFGLCSLYRARLNNSERDNKIWAGKLRILLKCASYMPAAACLLVGLFEMDHHFTHLHEASKIVAVQTKEPAIPYEGHSDPPLAEAVMILLGVGGLSLRLTDDSPRLFRNVCLMAAVLTLIAYGSWWWTEVLYDQQVIHSSLS